MVAGRGLPILVSSETPYHTPDNSKICPQIPILAAFLILPLLQYSKSSFSYPFHC